MAIRHLIWFRLPCIFKSHLVFLVEYSSYIFRQHGVCIRFYNPHESVLFPHSGVSKGQTMALRVVATACDFPKGNTETVSGNVPNAYWNADDRQVNLNMNEPRNSDSNYGSRSLVKVYEAPKDFSQPPSIRPVSDRIA